MSHSPNEDHANETAVLDEVQELTWALLDDNATEADVARLEGLLSKSEAARRDYLDCVQLHVGLHDYFHQGAPSSKRPQGSAKSPILGFLNAGTLPVDLPAENA